MTTAEPHTHIDVRLPGPLADHCDAPARQRIARAVAGRAGRLLAAYGLPAEARAEVSRAATDDRPIHLSVNGAECRFPMRILLSAAAAMEVTASDSRDDVAGVRSPASWVRWLRAQVEAAGDEAATRLAVENLVVWLVDCALRVNPGKLVGVEQAAAYAGRDPALATETVHRVLSDLLDLGVSVADRETVLDFLRTGVDATVVVEQLFRLLRTDEIKVRIDPGCAIEYFGSLHEVELDTKRIPDEQMSKQFDYLREAFRSDLGLPAPNISIVADPELDPRTMVVQVHHQLGWPTPLLHRDELLADASTTRLRGLGIPGRLLYDPYTGRRAAGVHAEFVPRLRDNGIAYWKGGTYTAVVAHVALRRRIWQLIGPAEVEYLVTRLGAEHPDLANVLRELYSITDLTRMLRRLVSESVPIADFAAVAEALIRLDPDRPLDLGRRDRWHDRRAVDQDAVMGVARRALSDVITRPEKTHGPLLALRTPAGFENAAAEADGRDGVDELLDEVWSAVEGATTSTGRPIVVTSPDRRAAVRRLLDREMPELPVWATTEIAPDVALETAPWLSRP